jgi:hypothetical protein
MTDPNHIAETVRNAIVEMLHTKQMTPAARAVQNMMLPVFETSTSAHPDSSVFRLDVPTEEAADIAQRQSLAALAGRRP